MHENRGILSKKGTNNGKEKSKKDSISQKS